MYIHKPVLRDYDGWMEVQIQEGSYLVHTSFIFLRKLSVFWLRKVWFLGRRISLGQQLLLIFSVVFNSLVAKPGFRTDDVEN